MNKPKAWDKFKEEKYKPISENYESIGFGTDKEPDSFWS